MNSPVVIHVAKATINFSAVQPVFLLQYKLDIASVPFALRSEYVIAWKEISAEKRATTKLYPTNSNELPVFVGEGPWAQEHPIDLINIELWKNFWLSLNREHTLKAFEETQQAKGVLALKLFYAQAMFTGNPAFVSKIRSNTLLPFSVIPEAGSFSFCVAPKKIAPAIIENRKEKASFE